MGIIHVNLEKLKIGKISNDFEYEHFGEIYHSEEVLVHTTYGSNDYKTIINILLGLGYKKDSIILYKQFWEWEHASCVVIINRHLWNISLIQEIGDRTTETLFSVSGLDFIKYNLGSTYGS